MGSTIHPVVLLAQANDAGVFTYFQQSNMAGKVIVVLLALFSLLAWTVMFGKYLDLSRLRSLNRHFERTVRKTPRVLKMGDSGESLGVGPYAQLATEAVQACYRYDTAEARARMGHVENALQRAVAGQSIRYESKMVLLGSIVTGAPFLGLLGTVWGVMDAFGGMAGQTSATLQNLAPGVSGALLTTVAGLVVAIPSVFGYNFLLSMMKLMITELENFASSLADRIELELAFADDYPAGTEAVSQAREREYLREEARELDEAEQAEDEYEEAQDEDDDDDRDWRGGGIQKEY